MAIVAFRQVSLEVGDLERAVRFYRDVRGLRAVGELACVGEAAGRALGRAGEPLRFALLGRDGMRIELLCSAAASARSARGDGVGLSHLTFEVDDLSSTLHSLRDRGVEVLDGSHCELGAGLASCLVRDPDGRAVLLIQQPVGVASPWDSLDEG
jgi:catechol 2,3-dioxygenase-like lactoylglutathione lyase family enzyme